MEKTNEDKEKEIVEETPQDSTEASKEEEEKATTEEEKTDPLSQMDPAQQQKMIEELMKQAKIGDPQKEEHAFWDEQPMKKEGEVDEGVIVEGNLKEVRQEPYAHPDGYHWVDMDLTDEDILEELY